MRAIKAFFHTERKYAFSQGITLPAMSYGQRLAQAMELARVDRARLARELEVSVQAIGQVLLGKSKSLTADKSAKAARLLRVDHFWLATGEGEPRPPGLSEEALAFAVRYDRLNVTERTRMSALLVAARDGVSDEQVERDMPITAKRARQRENS